MIKLVILTFLILFINSNKVKTRYWVCHHWDASDIANGAGHGDVELEKAICIGRGYNFAQGDGTCGSCWCCKWG